MKERLTIPSGEWLDELDSRRYPEPAPSARTEAQRDRDRVLYSTALLRLGHVTQVAAPELGYIFHSRLTHSLKVAQFARRLAEWFKQLADPKVAKITGAGARVVATLDEDATEAAALAHDLGHPPFGHLAEKELQHQASAHGSFEGNAQSFRIVTRLSLASMASFPPGGMNLTRRTINGLLKYPWVYEKGKNKWGAYELDREYFEWARGGIPSEERTIEAQLMDWADDVTYAVHDMDDFYRAGLVPLERLSVPGSQELRSFEAYLQRKDPDRADRLIAAARRLFLSFFPFRSPYGATTTDRLNLRKFGSWLITRYIRAVAISNAGDDTCAFFEIQDDLKDEVDTLKWLTWFYVIERPSLATIQHGQRAAIASLFQMYATAAKDPSEHRLFPQYSLEQIRAAKEESDQIRVVVDLIAGLTEESVLEIYREAQGISTGSILLSASGPS